MTQSDGELLTQSDSPLSQYRNVGLLLGQVGTQLRQSNPYEQSHMGYPEQTG